MGAGHKVNRKIYWVIFGVLALFTVLEILIAEMDTSRTAIIAGLILFAVAKAACVLLWYMHLLDETKVLKQTVILPFFFPVLYAGALIAEGLYRGGIQVFGGS